MRLLLCIAAAILACTSAPTITPVPASPTVTAGTTTAAASAPASPSRGPAVSIGLVAGSYLRLETEAEPFVPLDGPVAAVAPDGWSLAYWHIGLGVAATSADLRVIDLRTGTEQTLLRAEGDQPGTAIFRSDGSALLVTTNSLSFRGGADPPPDHVRIRTVDLATGAVRELLTMGQTRFEPLAWSARTHVIAGAWVGEGGVHTLYRLRDDGTLLAAVPGLPHYDAVAGGDARGDSFLASYAYYDSNHAYSGVHRIATDTLAIIARRDSVDESFLTEYQFRPASDEIVGLISFGPPTSAALDVLPGDLRTPGHRTWASATPGGVGSLRLRIDGHAAYLQTNTPGAPNRGWLRVDLDTGAATTLPTSARGVPSGGSFYITDIAVARLHPPAIAPSIAKNDAIAQVRGLSANVIRVDRIEAKLVTYRDIAGFDPPMAEKAFAPGAPMWAVAVSGDVRTSAGDRLKWGVWFIDARSGLIAGFRGDQGQAFTWPFFWDDLPDHS